MFFLSNLINKFNRKRKTSKLLPSIFFLCSRSIFFFYCRYCTALLHEFSENHCFVFQLCLWQQGCQKLSLLAIHFEEGSNGTRLHIMISLHLNPPAAVVAWLGFYTGKAALCTSQVFFLLHMRRWVPIKGQIDIMDRFPNPKGGHYACLSTTFGEGPLRTTQETMQP